VRGISIIGRNTQGVRLIDLDEHEKVVGLAALAERVPAVENGDAAPAADTPLAPEEGGEGEEVE
jgi:DNA gyrase subunit A